MVVVKKVITSVRCMLELDHQREGEGEEGDESTASSSAAVVFPSRRSSLMNASRPAMYWCIYAYAFVVECEFNQTCMEDFCIDGGHVYFFRFLSFRWGTLNVFPACILSFICLVGTYMFFFCFFS